LLYSSLGKIGINNIFHPTSKTRVLPDDTDMSVDAGK